MQNRREFGSFGSPTCVQYGYDVILQDKGIRARKPENIATQCELRFRDRLRLDKSVDRLEMLANACPRIFLPYEVSYSPFFQLPRRFDRTERMLMFLVVRFDQEIRAHIRQLWTQ